MKNISNLKQGNKEIKLAIKDILFKLVLFFGVFGFMIFMNFRTSYAVDNSDEKSVSLEDLSLVGEDFPIKLIELKDIHSNNANISLSFYANLDKDSEFIFNLYNQEGKQIYKFSGYYRKDKHLDKKVDVEKIVSISEMDARPGDLLTLTVYQKGNPEDEKIFTKTKLKVGPKIIPVSVNKGFLKEDMAGLFIANKSELPEGTEYYFGKEIKTLSDFTAMAKICVKLPNDNERVIEKTVYFKQSDYYIPITKENEDINNIKGYIKTFYYPGEHGRFVDGEIDKIWMHLRNNVIIYKPEVIVDKGYKLTDWETYRADSDGVNIRIYKAQYKKIVDDLDLENKDTYANIKFSSADGVSLEGKTDFNMPKGYSFSDTLEYKPPRASRKDGAKFVGWRPEFDPYYNFYSDVIYEPVFEETMASESSPIFNTDILIEDGRSIEVSDLIKNIDDLPEGIDIDRIEEPYFEEGQILLNFDLVFPDGSRRDDIKIEVNISFKDLEDDNYPEEGEDSEEEEGSDESDESDLSENPEESEDSEDVEDGEEVEDPKAPDLPENEENSKDEEDDDNLDDIEDEKESEESEEPKLPESPEEEGNSEDEENDGDLGNIEGEEESEKPGGVDIPEEPGDIEIPEDPDLSVKPEDGEDKKDPENPEDSKLPENTEEDDREEENTQEPWLPNYEDDFFNGKDSLAEEQNYLAIIKIRHAIKRIELKLDGIDLIKKNMPESYKRYKDDLDKAVLDARNSLERAKIFLEKYDKR